MRRRPFLRRLRQFPLLLSVLLFCFFGGRFLPLLRPGLISSLRTLAVASAFGTRPQQSFQILYEEFLSESDSKVEIIPVVEEISPVIRPAEPILPIEPEIESIPETPVPLPPVEIPEEFQGPIIEETMLGQAKTGFPSYGKGLIKNSTELADGELLSIISEPHNLSLSAEGPQVLVYHTHATESYEPYDSTVYDTRNTWRSTDEQENMIAVGEELCAAMEAHGISVIHDTALHDYPSYNGSYERSAATISSYLEKYPTISVLLDVHRDAVQREETLVKPVTKIDGEKTAQLMMIAGCDSKGSLNIPTWKENLRFGARIQDKIESLYPTLCRPLFVTHRKYNQHLSSASLLLEVGSHGNTLEEARRCGRMAGDAIGAYLAELLNSAAGESPPGTNPGAGHD